MSTHSAPSDKSDKSHLGTVLWIIGIVTLVLVLVCAGGMVGIYQFTKSRFSSNPESVMATAQSITEIDIPAELEPEMTMNFEMKLAVFVNKSERNHALILIAFPSSTPLDEKSMTQELKDQHLDPTNSKVVETEERTVSIRGKDCNLVINKTEDDSGNVFRQVTAVFTSKDGGSATFLMVVPEEKWNRDGEETLERVLRSMK